MRKNFILDTNVLLHDPNAIYQFEDNHVLIPIRVLEEIDQFKKELSERGRNARAVCRRLDEFRGQGARLAEGVPLAKPGSLVRVIISQSQLPEPLRPSQIADNHILSAALSVRDAEPDSPAILVTKDVNLRVRADALGLHAEDYDAEKIPIDELYTGMAELHLASSDIDKFYSDTGLTLSEVPPELLANEFVVLKDSQNPQHSALARMDGHGKLVPLRKVREGVWGIRPRNKEQHCALDLLLNDEIKLVTLIGKAGTGKTLLAIAVGLQKVVEEKALQKLLVSRPLFPLGRDVGYLPGTLAEKLNPWMQPIYDNLELLLGITNSEKKNGRSHQELMDLGFVEIEALTYIRGRSIPNQFMIVDEAQNLTPHEAKTIITRVGDGTKLIFTGDPYQIDNPYVDASNNGLTTIVERFKGQPIAGHITLTKGERSPLAELAANIL